MEQFPNLENWTEPQLQELIDKVELDKFKAAAEILPDKPPGFVKIVLIYVKFAKERLDLLDDLAKKRDHKLKNHQDKLNAIYRTLPEDYQW